MSFLQKLWSAETRAEKYDPIHPKDPALAELFGGLFTNTAAGIKINPETAMRIAAVYTCVSIISETVAQVPACVIDVRDKQRVATLPISNIIERKPNRFQNSFEWRETIMWNYLLGGRSVSQIITDGNGRVTDLIPIPYQHVTAFKAPDGRIAYDVRLPDVPAYVLLGDEVVDFRGPSVDGINCLNPIEINRETLGIAGATDQFAGKYFGSGANVASAVETNEELSDKAYQRLQRWVKSQKGIENAHSTMILEGGLKFRNLSLKAEDTQLLESRKFSKTEIAAIFRLPASKLGDTDSKTRANSEQDSIDFISDAITPKVIRLENVLTQALLTTNEQRRYKVNLKETELLRGDSAARAEFDRKRWSVGALSPNEIRQRDGLTTIENGDRYYTPANMVPSDILEEVLLKQQAGISQSSTDEESIEPGVPNE